MNPTTPSLLDDLLQEWKLLLTNWASSGMLRRAAQEALQLEEEPELLRDLVSDLSEGDFRRLPPVIVLPAGDMPGAKGAYAISTGTIYLNRDWLQRASREHVFAVLTEELGHHLDALALLAAAAGACRLGGISVVHQGRLKVRHKWSWRGCEHRVSSIGMDPLFAQTLSCHYPC